MEEVKKQTPIDLYLMVPHQVYEGGKQSVKVCLLACKRLRLSQDFYLRKKFLKLIFRLNGFALKWRSRNPGMRTRTDLNPCILK